MMVSNYKVKNPPTLATPPWVAAEALPRSSGCRPGLGPSAQDSGGEHEVHIRYMCKSTTTSKRCVGLRAIDVT